MAVTNSIIRGAFAGAWRPDPKLTVSQWADRNRILSPVASAEHGQWRTDRTPYLRDIMDALSPGHAARRIVFMKAAQLGATECGNNWLGYIIHLSPGPVLMVQPTGDVARRVSKQRIAPMLETTPALRARVKEARSRDSGNTVLQKDFTGGTLIITGANSAAGLRSMPIEYLFTDEIDEYPGDVDDQGDPVSLAEKRTDTFPNSKTFLVSTPTVKGLSRIEKEYLATDQRRYFVACPNCGAYDWIRWANIRWEKGDPDSARLACEACAEEIPETAKPQLLAGGQWRPTATSSSRRAIGFHLSALYSPLGWKSWADCAEEFEASKEDRFRLKTWVNTTLGETWEERGSQVKAGRIMDRLERYPAGADVPNGVGVLVAAVDVQGDRLEVQVKGYGAQEESWLIAFQQIHGDPGQTGHKAHPDHPDVWLELDQFLRQKFTHENGQQMGIELAVIDSGGHHTEEVYRFVKVREDRRVYAIRGGPLKGKEIVARPSRHNRYRVKLFTLCVDTAKDQIYSRLRIRDPGPGYIHFPEWLEQEYADQLTAERKLYKYKRGQGSVAEYVKTRERNEALDLEVYSLAALKIAGEALIRSLPERARQFAARPKDTGEVPTEAQPATGALAERQAPGRRRNPWVDSWK